MSTTTILQITTEQAAARRAKLAAKRDATPPAPARQQAPATPARPPQQEGEVPPGVLLLRECKRRWPGKTQFTMNELYLMGLRPTREAFTCPSGGR